MADLIEGSFAFHLLAAGLDRLIAKGELRHQEALDLIDQAESATKATLPNTPQAAEPFADQLRQVVRSRHQKMLDQS
jgi:hypothetical protein